MVRPPGLPSDSLSRLYTATPIAGLRFVRFGGLVQVNVDVRTTYPTGVSSVAAIPEGYRPAWRVYRDVGCGSGYPVRFTADGDAMSAYNYNGTAKENVSGGFSYITADPFPD